MYQEDHKPRVIHVFELSPQVSEENIIEFLRSADVRQKQEASRGAKFARSLSSLVQERVEISVDGNQHSRFVER